MSSSVAVASFKQKSTLYCADAMVIGLVADYARRWLHLDATARSTGVEIAGPLTEIQKAKLDAYRDGAKAMMLLTQEV